MANHPNRPSRARPRGPDANPLPEEIVAARQSVWLSQTEAAKTIYSTLRTWQGWEAGERRMHPGLWELFNLKINKK